MPDPATPITDFEYPDAKRKNLPPAGSPPGERLWKVYDELVKTLNHTFAIAALRSPAWVNNKKNDNSFLPGLPMEA